MSACSVTELLSPLITHCSCKGLVWIAKDHGCVPWWLRYRFRVLTHVRRSKDVRNDPISLWN